MNYPGDNPSGKFENLQVVLNGITPTTVGSRRPDGATAYFNIKYFQPNTTYSLQLKILSANKEYDHPAIYLGAKSVLNIKEKGIMTWLIKNQVGLNIALAIVLILATAVYTIYIIKTRNR